ncbi:MAG: lipid-A-disaccharide synthase N-terminal domain-containing protein [Candidatus Eisenbacteria sp.]|nr:lipid-A-disaccharide synthase N-terminal domain-containing protein [Candidatus Eisenbacteria bacterium]
MHPHRAYQTQLLFAARFVVQWLASERAKASIVSF